MPETGADPADTVEISRAVLESTSTKKSTQNPGLPGINSNPSQVRFSASPDRGGSIDRTAALGQVYSYTAQRVRRFKMGDEAVEVYSVPSTPVRVAVRDDFPPETPSGLLAVPGLRGAGANARATIDLSWDPDLEPRLSGYRVYRRDEGGDWRLLTPQLIRTAAYTDGNVEAGQRYTYRVTAVSDTGVESTPSAEASETAPSAE